MLYGNNDVDNWSFLLIPLYLLFSFCLLKLQRNYGLKRKDTHILFSGFMGILWGWMFPRINSNYPASGRGVRGISGIFFFLNKEFSFLSIRSLSVHNLSIISPYVQLTLQRESYTTRCSVRGIRKHVCSKSLSREKGLSVQSRCVKETEKEFIFGPLKPIFFRHMRKVHQVRWPRGNCYFVFNYLFCFVFIIFWFLSYCLLLFLLFFKNSHSIPTMFFLWLKINLMGKILASKGN